MFKKLHQVPGQRGKGRRGLAGHMTQGLVGYCKDFGFFCKWDGETLGV